ncbi:MAG: isochorismatase family protein [Planctomycetaceae bacterium]
MRSATRYAMLFLTGSLLVALTHADNSPNALQFTLRSRVPTSAGSGRHHIVTETESWDPVHTALIVCDVWDLHHSLNAVRREEEFAPRLNAVVQEARRRGVTIIHAPSSCMDSYPDHPARQRAIDTPLSKNLPVDIQDWCSRIPPEEQGTYPLDQSDGGADDDPTEAKDWAAKLTAMGRNPGAPWKKQSDLVAIEPQDYISDKGDEVWSILEAKGITHVILAGVHTNMCVLGRPFGLRQMAKNGKRVVLLRDMTDTMYNPASWPYVSHFTGTDRIIEHIEKYVCPTITSDQLIGGKPFRFKNDTRPHLVIVSAEDEYKTEETLPKFAADQLGKVFRITMLFGSETERNSIPGTEAIDEADVLLVSVRRRPLPPEQLARFRRFVDSGKPMVGIRTASHPFHLRDKPADAGLADWPEFDAQVWGGHYTNHHGNEKVCHVQIAAEQKNHAILSRVAPAEFDAGGSLYQVSPIADSATVLMTGSIESAPAEPVAWTYTRADSGKSFYTSLGHPADFDNPAFVRMLVNGLCWAAGIEPPEPVTTAELERRAEDWQLVEASPNVITEPAERKTVRAAKWYRCTIRVPHSLRGLDTVVSVRLPMSTRVWWNGVALANPTSGSRNDQSWSLTIRESQIAEVNLLVVHSRDPIAMEVNDGRSGFGGLCVRITRSAEKRDGSKTIWLTGRWQARSGDDQSFAKMPLPAIYGASPDILFEPKNPRWKGYRLGDSPRSK